nr:EAL domain-containing protein [uncultured Gellertiella sp.]
MQSNDSDPVTGGGTPNPETMDQDSALLSQDSALLSADGSPWSHCDMVVSAGFTNATRLAVIAISMDGRIAFVNPATERLFGYSRTEMVGQPITIIIPERMRGAHSSGLGRTAAGAQPNIVGKTVEVGALRKDGSEFPIEITLSLWENARGKFAGAMIKDITDRREREDRLLRLASQDTLTGLHNRTRITDLLRVELSAGRPAAVYLLDLDGFKEVNDTHGHVTGDALLQAIGVRLPYMLPHGAEVARFGSDEFAVLIPGVPDLDVARAQAAGMLVSFATPFELGGLSCTISASIGLVLTSPSETASDAEEVLASADLALYRAKAAGRQTFEVYDPAMRRESQALRDMRDELRIALRQGELELYYQPQARLADRQVLGFEALIRWNHPERGLLPPHAFLPALEQSALALDIGWWTLDEACRQMGHLHRIGYRSLKIGVNLFSAQFRAPNLAAKVEAAISNHGLPPAALELEVTETIALHDDGRSLDAISRLRQMGIGIAFDDFGTGFASLSSLQRYPLTTLKIDRSFIRDLALKPRDAAIVKALAAMSADLGLETIAEGIETPEQEALVRSFGCQNGQGYFYGRPMPSSALLPFLGRSEEIQERIAQG